MSIELINSNQNSLDKEENFTNIEAEIALIGCILWDNRNYEKISDFLDENHFVDQTNKIIFSTIKKLLDKNILSCRQILTYCLHSKLKSPRALMETPVLTLFRERLVTSKIHMANQL